jgi:cytochrome c oxidase subunit II
MKFKFKQLTITAALVLPLMGSGATRTVAPQRIDINAKRFSYEPNEITVKKGAPVTLIFHSQDVEHGFVSEDLGLKTDVPKHGTSEVTFSPDKTGDFGAKCSHFCGAGHGTMQLTIHVQD